MKNLVRLFVLVTLALVFAVSTSVFAQRSTAYTGDKSLTDVKMSVKIISGQLDALKIQIENLEKQNDKKIAGLERSKEIMLHNPSKNKFLIEKTDYLVKRCQIHTDSLITIYEQKKANLEDELISFTVLAAGKDRQSKVELKSRNVIALADAYLTVKYADKINSVGNDGNTLSADSALIENGWIDETWVSISGPARFSVSFKLESKARQVVAIPGPGQYCVSFTIGRETKIVSTRFDGYQKKGLDRKTQRWYAFIAGMPRKI